MERMQTYASGEETINKLREAIKALPDNCMEELKTEHGDTKFEFFGTMYDGIKLMGLGASSFGRC